MTRKPDPRAVRSKKVLKEATVSLLTQNPSISELTVQKISDQAELNRATFYLHFEDINDLMKQLVYEIFDDLSEKLKPLLVVERFKDEEQLLAFLDYFYDNRKLFAVLFEEPRFKKKMHVALKAFIQTRRDARGLAGTDHLASLDILAASLLGVIMWWIKEGTHFSSQYIANQISVIYRK